MIDLKTHTIYMLKKEIELIFFFLNRVSLRHLGWTAVARSQLTATSTSQIQVNSPASASRVAGITVAYHNAWLILVFLVETEFY